MTATVPRPRTGFLHRLHCARNGHYWERQLTGDGEGALWVCVRCGKHGDGVPLVAVGPTYHVRISEEPPEPQVHPDAEDAGDELPDVPPEWPSSWTAHMSDDGVEDVVHAADVSQPEETSPEPEPEPEPEPQVRRSQPSVTPAVVAVAVVSLAVAGGAAYLAFRRRRRHR
jgi:hypothetical protein